jgi:hypothetical protein
MSLNRVQDFFIADVGKPISASVAGVKQPRSGTKRLDHGAAHLASPGSADEARRVAEEFAKLPEP